ncbi:putative B3 domain-containing protein At1g78640 [Trifolium pratense]|uniref:putative B3 domain-containing protein At1g78640 n=1 Tax=Trifolium pratense TaxID=57577 RepID=UPI001E696C5D|nr:putative B3 domain-containing protein At1g78640 [Trifolium pratense]
MACNDVNINWEIKKVLTESDVLGVTCRLLVGKKCAEAFVVPIFGRDDVENGVNVKIRDYDTHSVHYLVFKKCSSRSYGFGRNWMKEFVSRRGLKGGDMIGLHWDQNNQQFNFSVIEAN